jgi:hypothetical protein
MSQLLKANVNGDGELIETCGAKWMAGRTKSECVIVVRDGLLQVVHPSQLLESLEKSYRQVTQQISATLDVQQRTLLKVVSILRNFEV